MHSDDVAWIKYCPSSDIIRNQEIAYNLLRQSLGLNPIYSVSEMKIHVTRFFKNRAVFVNSVGYGYLRNVFQLEQEYPELKASEFALLQEEVFLKQIELIGRKPRIKSNVLDESFTIPIRRRLTMLFEERNIHPPLWLDPVSLSKWKDYQQKKGEFEKLPVPRKDIYQGKYIFHDNCIENSKYQIALELYNNLRYRLGLPLLSMEESRLQLPGYFKSAAQFTSWVHEVRFKRSLECEIRTNRSIPSSRLDKLAKEINGHIHGDNKHGMKDVRQSEKTNRLVAIFKHFRCDMDSHIIKLFAEHTGTALIEPLEFAKHRDDRFNEPVTLHNVVSVVPVAPVPELDDHITKQLAAQKDLLNDISAGISGSQTREKSGFVYIATNPAFPGWCKIGSTINLSERLSSFNTYSPHADFKFEYFQIFPDRVATEKAIHSHFKGCRGEGEWFLVTIDKVKILISQMANQPSEKKLFAA